MSPSKSPSRAPWNRSRNHGRTSRALSVAPLVVLVTAIAGSAVNPAHAAANMTVELVNALTEAPVPNVLIVAKRRSGDTLTKVAQQTSDSAGRAAFTLSGLGSGSTYVFFAQPYNGGWVQSADVRSTGTFRFLVGSLPVNVIAGNTGRPYAGAAVTAKQRLTDGSLKWIKQGTTDAAGMVIFDLPGLGSGKTYVLEAKSPVDGSTKRSNPITETGGMTFVVGNAPLAVTLIDALSHEPLPGVRITAKERLADGSLKWAAARDTDDNGRVVFDLAGLGSGRIYVLFATVFNSLASSSGDLTAAGDFLFKVGQLAVTVVTGGTQAALPGLKVSVYERLATGSTKFTVSGLTDERGVLRLDLAGLDQGRRYFLKASSPWDGTTKTSNDITSNGRVTFIVGNAPLRVTLLNGIAGERLANQKLTVRERLSGDTSKWVVDRLTDANGQAVFDLDGLGAGRKYFLTANPYVGTATSPDLTAPGEFEFRVGMLEVTVVSAGDSTPLPNTSVTAREKLADGSLKWIASGNTDANGVIRFDLAGLGAGRTYVLEAKSPIDGTTKRSDPITSTGRFTFRVGNAPLAVALINALSGDPLPNVEITASLRGADGKLRWAASRVTDASGRTAFDLTGLGTGSVYVLSCVPYNGGTAYSDDIRMPGSFDFRVGKVEVTAVGGATGQPLAGITVTAKEKRADGKYAWITQGTTDERGIIRFDFAGLGTGRVYVLEAASPTDGSTKRSQDISAIGAYVFRVGNAPVIATLRDALSGVALPDVEVTAYERLANGEWRWVRAVTTGEDGRAVFDLDGLDAGRVYVLTCEPFNGGWVESEPITKPGPFDFLVGNLEVTVLSGIDGQPLADNEVAAYELLAEDEWHWTTYGYTDANGVIRFDLPGLGSGRRYVLVGHSPVDESHKYSDVITEPGRITFVVGNPPLNLTMINGLTGAPVAGAEISAYEITGDEEWHWASWTTTDDNGKAVFDLDGIGKGRAYVLWFDPYDAGGVHSDLLSEPGDIVLRVGTIPVTLTDGDNNMPMVDVGITAYEILGEDLHWAKHGHTDANGVVRFDLEGVSLTTVRTNAAEGPGDRRYVFHVDNPFSEECKEYFSRVVDSEGPVDFRITRDGEYPIDLTPPQITIAFPGNGATVDSSGFTMTGSAADDATLTEVVVTVADPVAGTSVGTATYDPAGQTWSFAVTAAMLTLDQTVTITARAYDQARNHTDTTVAVLIIDDMAPPQITFTSHQPGDNVDKTGFLLSGLATDDTRVASLVATVDDPVLGRTVNQQPVDVEPRTGQWTLAVLNGQVTQGQSILVTMTATDARSNSTTASISLTVVAVDSEIPNLLNRITFGATPQLRAEVVALGGDAFMAQQLNPAGIDDSAFDAMLAAQPQPSTTAQLQTYLLRHAIFSRRQLLEVLTQFWDNHFNTDINKTRVVAYELTENNAFRAAALGRFRDLLEISAKSPAMLIYLDNAMSLAANPNENYARELMELHTLGVDGGYTQRDVEAVARIFTGWQVQNGQFFFNPADHDTGVKVALGRTFPAGRGIEDGEELLDLLAVHPSTARFLCTKLSRLFVTDRPTAALVDRCAQAYLASDGLIATTVQTILNSPEFGDPTNFRAKVKTPLEFVVATVRHLNATPDYSQLIDAMSNLGMRLFQNPIPTGWSETGDDWINSNALIQRIQFVNAVAYGAAGQGTNVDLRAYFANSGYTTADGIVGQLFQLVFHNDFTTLDRDVALNILTNNGSETFDINAPNANARLRRLVSTVFSYPGYQFQ